MAGINTYSLPRYGAARVLLITPDRQLAARLQTEFKLAQSDLTWKAQPPAARALASERYEVVVLDATALAAAPPNWLAELRALLPAARFLTLVEPQAEAADEPAGFDAAHPRPRTPQEAQAFVAAALGRKAEQAKAVPVAMNFDFMPRSAETLIRRRLSQGVAEAVPVAMDLRFLPKATDLRGKRKAPSAMVAVVFHAVALVIAVVIPLLFTETIASAQLTTWLVASPTPPPPPPPPAAAPAQPARRVRRLPTRLDAGLRAPVAIPKEVPAPLDTPEIAPELVASLAGGVPGGIPGGVPGGAFGGVLGATSVPEPPPAPKPAPRGPIRVGGSVQPPRLIQHIQPLYPLIARQARVEGDVRIDATIDPRGRVVELRVLQGHPLLTKAAVDAVKEWVYAPTLLNGRPVPILIEITVTFNLG